MTAAPSKGLGRIFEASPDSMRSVDSTDAALRQINAKIGDGAKARSLGSISFTAAAPQDVEHLLGKNLTGWRASDIGTPGGSFFRSASSDDTKFLRLTCSATLSATIEVW